jgi:hypothetical protein
MSPFLKKMTQIIFEGKEIRNPNESKGKIYRSGRAVLISFS